jgi:TonB family protein
MQFDLEDRMRNAGLLVTQTAVLVSAMTLMLVGSALLAQDAAEKSPDTVYEVGNGVTAPKAIYQPDPQYNERARKKKINGTVIVAMIVTAEGKVRDLKVIKSLDKGLDKQAIAAVSTWKFEPATKDGKPVAVHLPVEVDFRLY